MSIKEEILKILNTSVARHKGVPVNILGLPVLSIYKKQSIKNSFYKLHSDNLITCQNSQVRITSKGRCYLKNINKSLQIFESNFKKDQKKDLLLIFDVPEIKKSEREWLRRHLIKFGYKMIQKSVWVGPSPLPKDFLAYIKKIKIQSNIKTFKLEKGYTA